MKSFFSSFGVFFQKTPTPSISHSSGERLHFHIFASINEEAVIPERFKEVCRFEKFYLEVGDLNKICFSCFDDLDYDFENIKKNITEHTEYIKTGPKEIMEPYNYRLGFDIPKGKYEFDLIGLEKIEKTERESKNYGYAFVFKKKRI